MNGRHPRLRLLYTVAAIAGGLIGGGLTDYARHLMSSASNAATPPNGQVISASEFRLVDEAGKVRARLFLDGSYEPKLALYDWRGGDEEQVSLSANAAGGQLTLAYLGTQQLPAPRQGLIRLHAAIDGGALQIGRGSIGSRVPTFDEFPEIDLGTSKFGADLNLASVGDQKRQIQASVQNDGAVVRLWDQSKQVRASLELDNDDNPGYYLYDQKGKARSSLELNKTGDPQLSLLDAAGYFRAVLRLDDDGNSSLTLNDAKNARAVLGSVYLKDTTTGSTEHRSPSSLVLFRENGKVLWSTP